MIQLSQQAIDRFCSKIDLPADWETNPTGGCWIWMGPVHSSGYPTFSFEHKIYQARRLSFEYYWNIIPSKRLISICNDHICVNPHHMIESHGLRHSREYRIFRSILQRIFNPDNQAFYNYGGRGLDIDSRYDPNHKEQGMNIAFQNFITDLKELNMYPILDEMSIDRIDNDRGYLRDNIRLATRQEQNQNTRSNVVTPDMVREIREKHATGNYFHNSLAEEYGVSRPTITGIVNNKTWINA